jgi:hypothetical protein
MALGHARPQVVEVVVESAAPYDVVVYEVGLDTIEQGRKEYRALLARLRECVDSDTWPGSAPEIVDFALPVWALAMDDVPSLTLGGEVIA